MPERRSSALLFLAVLVALSVIVALVSGLALYLESRASSEAQAEAMTGGRVANGAAAIAAYGCGSCHMIPGIHGANGKVGPDLTGIGVRVVIAGSLPNDPRSMTRWLEHPQALRPGSAMPEMGVTERDARDIAAYLYAKQ